MPNDDEIMDKLEKISARLQADPEKASHGIEVIYFDAAEVERQEAPDTKYSITLRIDALKSSFADL